MSAPIKRDAESAHDSDHVLIKRSTVDAENKDLEQFLSWATKNNFLLCEKVKVHTAGCCAHFGLIAVDDIEEGMVLFQIPRSLLLSPENSSIAPILKEDDSIQGSSRWPPLLLALMYEYHNPVSKWRPYLDLVPNFKELELPMFWPRSDLEDPLKGTGVVEAVDRDLKSVGKEFEEIVLPFVKKHEDVFTSSIFQDLEFYKKMVAFVMAYSFTEPLKEMGEEEEEEEDCWTSPPMMVPMADILNHVAKNNAQLMFEKDCLKMVTTQAVKKGEEVFNTYGQLANWHLLHMYGFAEPYPQNSYDTVDIPVDVVFQAAEDLDVNNPTILQEKRKFLKDMGLLCEDGAFVLGLDGILTEEEMFQTLKVLVMSQEDFQEHVDNEGWTEEEEEEDSLSFDGMTKVPDTWRAVLTKCGKCCLERYSKSLQEDEEEIVKLTSADVSCSRQRMFTVFTTYGQKKLLQKMIDTCR